MKRFNAILKNLCELPRFLGIRALVHNIHESCPILTKKQKDQNAYPNGQYRQSRFPKIQVKGITSITRGL